MLIVKNEGDLMSKPILGIHLTYSEGSSYHWVEVGSFKNKKLARLIYETVGKSRVGDIEVISLALRGYTHLVSIPKIFKYLEKLTKASNE